MSLTQLNTATKATLIQHIQELQAQQESLKIQAANAAALANYFESVIISIEKILNDAPFLNKDGKFFKKVFWILSNYETIKTIIEQIVTAIKSWRSQINEIIQRQKALNEASKEQQSTE